MRPVSRKPFITMSSLLKRFADCDSNTATVSAAAHTLAFALGLLAIYPDEQEKLYQQIVEINPVPDAEVPYTDYTLYTRALAIVYETLRLYPAVIGIPKAVTAASDTLLPVSERGPGGNESGKMFVPRGTHMSLDVQSLHHDRELSTVWRRINAEVTDNHLSPVRLDL